MIVAVLLAIFFIALLVGIIGNIAGIGGGVIMVIVLIYLFRLSPLDAAGLSLLTIVFSSLSGLIQDVRKKLVDVKLFTMVAAIAVAGSIFGSVMTYYTPTSTFKGVFSIITVFIGVFSILSSRRQTKGGVENYSDKNPYSKGTGILSLVAGVVSGFIGIGIGGIMGTYLTAIKRVKPKIAFATIISTMFPVSITGATIHFYYTGFVNIAYAPSLILGAMLGGIIGSRIIGRAPQTSLRFFQGYIIIAFGILSAILYLLSF